MSSVVTSNGPVPKVKMPVFAGQVVLPGVSASKVRQRARALGSGQPYSNQSANKIIKLVSAHVAPAVAR